MATKPGYASAIHDVVDRLFVYGSLRTGQPARSLIQDHVVASVPARTTGRLIGFADYPGLLDDGPGPVVGELLTLTDLAAAFALLDAYEGGDFVRVLRRIERTDDGDGDRAAEGAGIWAWCYLLADPRLADDGVPVPGGDWARFRP
ncbi:MAG: gamma-glutamylcyclotransferase [Kofleriaceae bacterium]|nr:gamma-glutamylcyclotransferase [Kofleriaceae bacterium]